MQDIHEFKVFLEQADVKNDQHFQMAIVGAIGILKLLPPEIARRFNMSISGVNRWRVGRNAPHSLMRILVYRYLLEQVERTTSASQ